MEKILKIINDTSALVLADPLAAYWLAGGAAILLGLLLMLINAFKVARIRGALNKEILVRTKLNEQLENAEQQLQQLQDEIKHQNESLAQLEKDKQAETLRTNELSEKLTAQQTAFVTMEQQLTQSNVQLKEQSAIIAGFQQAIAQQKEQSAQITELQQALATQNLKNTQLSNLLTQYQEQTSGAQQAVDARITELARQLEQARHDISNLPAQQPSHLDEKLKQVEQVLQTELHEKDLVVEDLRNKLASLEIYPTQDTASMIHETVSMETAKHEAETMWGVNEASYTDNTVVEELFVTPEEEVVPEPVMVEAKAVKPVSQKKGWKGMFGGKAKDTVSPSVEEAPDAPEVTAPEPVITEAEPVKPVSQKKGWKGMFGGKAKATEQPVVEEAPAASPEIVEVQADIETEEESVNRHYTPSVSEDLQLAKAQLKGLFGKFGKKK